MDKTEYQERLAELQEFILVKDYSAAYDLVNSIDWKKVKSTRTLNMVADVYEVNKDYEKCRQILVLALGRSSIGKSILYRLTEICIKQRDVKAAQNYYEQYCKLAPRDNSRLILEYKIGRATNRSIDEQIKLLETYKEREYTERWAYELALLYSKAGYTQKCIDACDDMILWFSEGKYVLKAMELKKRYKELSPSQQLYYDKEQRGSDARLLFSRAEKGSYDDKKPAAKASVMERMDAAGAAVTKDVNIDDTEKLPLSNEEIQKVSVRSEQFMGGKPDLKQQLQKSIKEVYSGVKEAPKVESKPLSTDEFNLDEFIKETMEGFSTAASKGSLDKAEARDEAPVQEENEKDEHPETNTAYEKSEIFVGRTVPVSETESVSSGEEEPDSEVGEFCAESEAPIELEAEMQGSDKDDEDKEADIPVIDPAVISQLMQEDKSADSAYDTDKDDTAEETEDAAAEEESVSEEAVEASDSRKVEYEEDITEGPIEDAIEIVLADSDDGPKSGKTKKAEAKPAEEKASKVIYDDREIPDPEPTKEEKLTRTIPLGKLGQNTVPISIEEVLKSETPEERRIRILNNALPTKMSDQQRQIFTYFARIPGMDSQILEAMTKVYEHAGEHTSKGGNIAVMGAVGTGKSRLSDGLVKAMCSDMELEVAKTARVTGDRMNMLDPAKVVSRMAGGFLIIENASDMSSKTVEKLNKAMEFRTDCMVLIIEDEKNAMRAFLKRYTDFAQKISGLISIPVFTNDELVTFARTYCAENNCQMDELGVLALYSMISNGQSEDQPMTISEVKGIIDTALSKAKRSGRRGRKSSSKDKMVILYEKDFA